MKVKEVRVSSLFGRVVRESPRKRKLATYGEAEVTSILFAEEEKAPPAAPASLPCSKKPRRDPLLRSISDPVPPIYITLDPDLDLNPDPGFAIILKGSGSRIQGSKKSLVPGSGTSLLFANSLRFLSPDYHHVFLLRSEWNLGRGGGASLPASWEIWRSRPAPPHSGGAHSQQ
jgi:hypothetical protein